MKHTDHETIATLLSFRYYSALDYAKETGSTKLTSRISEMRRDGHLFDVREITPPSGRKYNEYKYLGKTNIEAA